MLFRAKMLTIYNVNHDHNHIHVCDCAHNCMCPGCHRKEKRIVKLQLELEEVKTENVLHKQAAKIKMRNIVNRFLKTDAKIRPYAGLPNKKNFNDLVSYVTRKAKDWSGSIKVISRKVRRNFKAPPKKTGPRRKLSVKEELTLVLLKLRTAVTNEMLADLFDSSNGGASQVINNMGQVSCSRIKASDILAIKRCNSRTLRG